MVEYNESPHDGPVNTLKIPRPGAVPMCFSCLALINEVKGRFIGVWPCMYSDQPEAKQTRARQSAQYYSLLFLQCRENLYS